MWPEKQFLSSTLSTDHAFRQKLRIHVRFVVGFVRFVASVLHVSSYLKLFLKIDYQPLFGNGARALSLRKPTGPAKMA